MKYLEAKKILRNSTTHLDCNILLASSSQTENLSPYIEAYAAQNGINITLQRLDFGVLEQYLRSTQSTSQIQILLLYPWDFCRYFDWRIEQSNIQYNEAEALSLVNSFIELLGSLTSTIFYIDADIPAKRSHLQSVKKIRTFILSQVVTLGGKVVPSNFFSFKGYLESGMGISNQFAPELARLLATDLVTIANSPLLKKVLITDLDNTLWQGVIGEDGPSNVVCEIPGSASHHYHYQVFLSSLGDSGVLLIAVSKNDQDLAIKTFESISMPLKQDDFYAIIADYQEKSHHIEALSAELDLPLNSFVFVDDNPVEIAKVTSSLPDVHCLKFPADEIDSFPVFYQELHNLFPPSIKTAEDRDRKQLYKQRKMANEQKQNSHSIEEYLSSLDMKMHINTTSTNHDRAFQLINKTNQFNLNGRRLNESEFENSIADDTKVITARLSDKFGDHGEILACLLSPTYHITHWVMSCRVLQRQAEHAFLLWLLKTFQSDSFTLYFQQTERNTPFWHFLESIGLAESPEAHFIVLDRMKTIEALTKAGIFIEVIADECSH